MVRSNFHFWTAYHVELARYFAAHTTFSVEGGPAQSGPVASPGDPAAPDAFLEAVRYAPPAVRQRAYATGISEGRWSSNAIRQAEGLTRP